MRSRVQKDVKESLDKVSAKLVPQNQTRYLTLPKEGLAHDAVRAELEALANMDHTRWEDGYVSGAVYHGEEELLQLQTEAYGKFTVANPIHPDVFPGVRKMEAEVVSMVLNVFHAPPGGAGVTTSGGTESILMACLAARQKAYAERGVTEPEMLVLHISALQRELCDLTNSSGFSPKLAILPSERQASISVSRYTLLLARLLRTR